MACKLSVWALGLSTLLLTFPLVSKQKRSNKLSNNETTSLGSKEPINKTQLINYLTQQKRPQSWIDIVSGLNVQSKREKKTVSRHLSEMLKSGQLLFNRKEQYCLVQQSDLETGIVIGHADGFGFLKRDAGGDDMFIPPHEMRALMNGDRVVVSRGKLNRQGKLEALSLIHISEPTRPY